MQRPGETLLGRVRSGTQHSARFVLQEQYGHQHEQRQQQQAAIHHVAEETGHFHGANSVPKRDIFELSMFLGNGPFHLAFYEGVSLHIGAWTLKGGAALRRCR
jgi:hypothetical protein